jgi:serine/threonine-protein kinase ATR
MSRGLSQNSEKLTILPCAIQAYSTSLGNDNYISKYLDASNSEFLDGLNTHLYSYVYDNFVGRIALNPEDPRSEVWSVNNLHRFSNANLSGKPIYVTEFGYDSDDGSEDCIQDICISEFEQAIYGPRMALILYRLGVSQFYWYYFANVDYVSMLHNRSGLTASYSSGFQKKLSFSSFEILKESIGDFYFHHIIREDDDAYIYAFSNGNGKIMRIVGWRPTSENHKDRLWIKFPFNDAIESVVSLVSVDGPEENISYVRGVNELKISLSGIPVVIKIKE